MTVCGIAYFCSLELEDEEGGIMARRTLARREPIILYRLELEDSNTLNIRAWEANNEGRMINDRFFGEVTFGKYPDEKVPFTWLLSNQTDELNSLPEEVADFVCKVDDLCRGFLEEVPNFKQTLSEFQARQ